MNSGSVRSDNFPENLPPGWKKRLKEEKNKLYFKALSSFLLKEYREKKVVFPPRKVVLRALQDLDIDKVKIVILGQDPYHGEGQAIGRSFAVPNELMPKPPSLINIYKEIESDLGIKLDRSKSDLSGWARQGVFLLNTVLTVRAHQAFSHRNNGWEEFTDQIIQVLDQRSNPVVFILWGSAAQKKKQIVVGKQHYFLESPHPSPLSSFRGFFGCRHFSKANAILRKLGKDSIDWSKVCS